MPQTIIKVKTFMCPLGVGHHGPPGVCRFARREDLQPLDGRCPVHGLPLIKTTLSVDTIFNNIMGEEDIEPEIEQEDIERIRRGQATRTTAEKEAYRTKRKQDIAQAIIEARKLEDIS